MTAIHGVFLMTGGAGALYLGVLEFVRGRVSLLDLVLIVVGLGSFLGGASVVLR